MKHRIRTLDELRAELRLARWRFSVRELERASGVGHTTINQLLGTGELRRGPTAATIRRLSAFLDAQAEEEAGDADRPYPVISPLADVRETPASSPNPSPSPSPSPAPGASAHFEQEVPVPAEYWQGVADATLRMLHVASEELRELCDSDVLGEGTPRRSRSARAHGPRRP